jgi:hypothetical protein
VPSANAVDVEGCKAYRCHARRRTINIEQASEALSCERVAIGQAIDRPWHDRRLGEIELELKIHDDAHASLKMCIALSDAVLSALILTGDVWV